MAVPKKRVGHSAQGHRRSNWKATVPETTTCKQCGELTLTHTVCPSCGYYKGKAVSIKAEGYQEEAAEEKKAPKKTAKKTKKSEEPIAEVKEVKEVKEEKAETETETEEKE